MTSTATAASATGTNTAAALAGIKRPRSGSGGTTPSGAAAGTGTSAAAQPQSAAAPSTALASTSGDARATNNKRDGKDGTANTTKGGDEESESTPEGLLMAHALDTLTPRQLSQFEAYRNAAFPADAVAAYVSHRLCHNEERRYVRRHGTAGVLGGGRAVVGGGEAEDGAGETGLGVIAHSGWGEAALRRCPFVDHVEAASAHSASAATASASASPTTVVAPPLRDMVAPETEQEVVAVVSTLAKLHAQRLVAAARRLATAEGHPLDEPLRPHHVVQAKRYRTEAGLDPGFFMGVGGGSGGDGKMAATGAGGVGCGTPSGSAGAAAAAALDVVNVHRLRMEAALEAQRQYDAQFDDDGDKSEKEETEDDGDDEKAKTIKKRRTGEKGDDVDDDAKMEE